MKVSKYIGDLLFEYECIVIPGFGGFITKNTDSKINAVQHQFNPPFKEIVFNSHLKTNDGMLVNLIARQEGIAYTEAKAKIEKFVRRCNYELYKGRRIKFRKIGHLEMDANEVIHFIQDKSQNYLADSFGLNTFISPAIKRDPIAIFEKKKFRDRKLVSSKSKTTAAKHEPSSTKQKRPNKPDASVQYKSGVVKDIQLRQRKEQARYIHINISAIIILIGLAALTIWQFGKVQNFYNQYSGFLPFLYPAPEQYAIENGNKNNIMEYTEDIPGLEKSYEYPGVIYDEDKDQSAYSRVLENYRTDEGSNNDQGAMNKEQGAMNKEQGAMNKEQGAMNKEQGAMNKEQGEMDNDQSDSSQEQPIVEEPVETTSQHTSVKLEPPSEYQITDYKYFIVAGAFGSEANAQRFVKELQNKGFDAAIFEQTNSGLYRVCYSRFTDITEANKQIAIIRKEENQSAWLLSR